jgi:hypothetical protein
LCSANPLNVLQGLRETVAAAILKGRAQKAKRQTGRKKALKPIPEHLSEEEKSKLIEKRAKKRRCVQLSRQRKSRREKKGLVRRNTCCALAKMILVSHTL